jgi:hypothetical protein
VIAAIRRVQVKAGQMDEVKRRLEQGLIPLISQIPGFVCYHAVDAGDDVAISVTLYTDRAAAEAAVKVAKPWAEANIVHLMGAAEATVGEVVISFPAAIAN